MLVVYDSLTGNVKRFVTRLPFINEKIHNDLIVEERFVLITYTIGFGNVPQTVSQFLELNHTSLIAVAASGNKNWGSRFAASADIISQQYDVPILHKFELAGTEKDVEILTERLREIASY